MNRLATQLAFALLLLAAVAHRTSAQTAGDQNTSGAAPAATGLDTATQMTENPPLSGLDEPTFEPGYGARSYLAPKAEVSESVDSNGANDFSKTNITTTSRALGSVELRKLWKMHPLAIDYVGGVDWYNGPRSRVYQVHSLAATQRFLWRTGQFALRDSFSYLPEGAFGFGSFGGSGGAYGGGGLGGGGRGGGGLGGGGITGGTGGGSFSNGQFGSIGTQPRITNMGIADVTQYLSPRNAIVLSAGYGLTHFLGDRQTSSCAATVGCYFNSQETILRAGYNRQVSRHNQIGVVYEFEELHFPTSSAGSLNVNLLQLEVGHRVSGRLYFLAAGGPEWVHRNQSEELLFGGLPTGLPCLHPTILLPCGVVKSSFLTGSARASLRYHWSARTELLLTYLRYISPGSGFFGGANTDSVRFAINHSLARRWNIMADTGYSKNSRLLAATASVARGSSNYHYWYAGAGMHRQLGRYFGAFASYQYNAFGFGSKGCTGTDSVCGRSYGRNVGLIGLHWTPHPIRLD
jgi:hypothetical protein